MSKEAEKLAQECDESAEIWASEIDTRRKAAALLRRQDEQIKEMREALNALYIAAPISLECHSFHHSKGEQHSHTQECHPKSAYLTALAAAAAALSNTKDQ